MSLVHYRRPIRPTVSKMRNFPGRKADGGLVGTQLGTGRATCKSCVYPALDARRLRNSDLIDHPRSTKLLPSTSTATTRPMAIRHSFTRSPSAPPTRSTPVATTRLRGFLHYHIPIPSRPLSGGLRFRCTPSLKAFSTGTDLLTPSGLPWTIPSRKPGPAPRAPYYTKSAARQPRVFRRHHRLQHDVPLQATPHAPWLLDLSAPSVALIPGPNSLLRCDVYPAVASYGAALVCFEYTENPASPHELAIRVLELRSDISFHPPLRAPPAAGTGRAASLAERLPRQKQAVDTRSAEMAAALYALVHGPAPVPLPVPPRRVRRRQRPAPVLVLSAAREVRALVLWGAAERGGGRGRCWVSNIAFCFSLLSVHGYG
ncbi:hypothetical protein B0H14DRAFT_2616177 [Mycena olivaceomarginata]|nr:hypothetical protein B0H14DRAFT_2616177 [Mycena olivaceomarginata]